MNDPIDPEQIFEAIFERYELIAEAESDERRQLYRRMKLREALKADAEFKGIRLTEAALDALVKSLA